MAENRWAQEPSCRLTVNDPSRGMTDEELLDFYLSSSNGARQQFFATTGEAAELTGLSRRTIQSWVEEGRIRAIPVGRKLRIDVASLRKYLRQHLIP